MFAVAAVSFVLTLLLVSVYKLLLNYFHQLLFRPHLPPKRTIPSTPFTLLLCRLADKICTSAEDKLCRPPSTTTATTATTKTFHLHCFCQILSAMSKPCNPPPPFPDSPPRRSQPAYQPGTSPVSLLIGCKSWFKLLGRIFTTFVSVSVWFFISSDFPSSSFHVCVIVSPLPYSLAALAPWNILKMSNVHLQHSVKVCDCKQVLWL